MKERKHKGFQKQAVKGSKPLLVACGTSAVAAEELLHYQEFSTGAPGITLTDEPQFILLSTGIQ